MGKFVYSFLTILLFVQSSYAAVSDELKKVVIKHKIPSMSVMIKIHNKIITHEAYGVRKDGESDQLSIDDSFHLGSCAKAFTAALVLKLVSQKKLTLEAPIVSLLKEVDKKKFKDVRIKDLLTHSSGIKGNIERDSLMKAFKLNYKQSSSLVYKDLNASSLVNIPGKKFEYSNLGYMLLGELLVKIYRSDIESIYQKELFKPLGMSSCTFGPAGKDGKKDVAYPHEKGRFWGFNPLDPKDVYSDNPPAFAAAGGISCSQKDWGKFISFVYSDYKKQSLLGKEEHALLSAKNTYEYSLGAWGTMTKEWSGRLLSHAGSNTLNYAYAIVGLDQKFALLVNTNSYAPKAAAEMMIILKKYYLESQNEK